MDYIPKSDRRTTSEVMNIQYPGGVKEWTAAQRLCALGNERAVANSELMSLASQADATWLLRPVGDRVLCVDYDGHTWYWVSDDSSMRYACWITEIDDDIVTEEMLGLDPNAAEQPEATPVSDWTAVLSFRVDDLGSIALYHDATESTLARETSLVYMGENEAWGQMLRMLADAVSDAQHD